jgi:hypothetical protein
VLTIDAHIPLAVELHAADRRPDLVPEHALQVLRALNLLALSNRFESAETPGTEANHDLARLEAKVDMLLALVGSLVAEQGGLPPVHAVRFNAEALETRLDRSFPIGASVILELYLSSELPRPLVVAASVTSVKPHQASGDFDVEFKLGPMHGSVKDEIERYIFLRHRKMLARKTTV